MFNSGILYNLTGDGKYATLVKKLFLKYAKLNPTLKNIRKQSAVHRTYFLAGIE